MQRKTALLLIKGEEWSYVFSCLVVIENKTGCRGCIIWGIHLNPVTFLAFRTHIPMSLKLSF
jgi:hypothetical protein